MNRVVFDTSTLVSAALRIGSVPHQALLKALASCDVCASIATLQELGMVLDRGKFDRYLNRKERRAFVANFRRSASLFVVEKAHVLEAGFTCRDPKDDQFLALALAAEADAIVSSDEDLLVLHPWRGISVLTLAGFLYEGDTDLP